MTWRKKLVTDRPLREGDYVALVGSKEPYLIVRMGNIEEITLLQHIRTAKIHEGSWHTSQFHRVSP